LLQLWLTTISFLSYMGLSLQVRQVLKHLSFKILSVKSNFQVVNLKFIKSEDSGIILLS